MIALRAHFDGKVIIPDEPIDLPKDRSFVVQIELEKRSHRGKKLAALDWIADNAIEDDSLPSDYSYNLDHYLYGTPKKDPPKL